MLSSRRVSRSRRAPSPASMQPPNDRDWQD
jgi:hypothetical protein